MNVLGWRTSLVVQALDQATRRAVPVVVGAVDTAADGVQVVLRVGTAEALRDDQS